MVAYKKTCFVFVLILVFSLMSAISLAWGEDTTYPEDINETEMLFFEITRPLVNDSTTSKYFYICGDIKYDNITVETYIYSDLDGCYVPFANVYDESEFNISEPGFFNNEIILPNKGENRLLVVAYRTSEPDNRQFSKFNVFLRSESIVDRFMNGLDKALDFFSNLIP